LTGYQVSTASIYLASCSSFCIVFECIFFKISSWRQCRGTSNLSRMFILTCWTLCNLSVWHKFDSGQHRYTLLRHVIKVYVDTGQPLFTVV